MKSAMKAAVAGMAADSRPVAAGDSSMPCRNQIGKNLRDAQALHEA